MSMEYWSNDTDIRKPMFCEGGGTVTIAIWQAWDRTRASAVWKDREISCTSNGWNHVTEIRIKLQSSRQRSRQRVSLRALSVLYMKNILTEASKLLNVIIRHRGNDADSGKPESSPNLDATLSTINPKRIDLESNQGRRGKRPATAGLSSSTALSAYHKSRKSKSTWMKETELQW
jgi:hypothetical protein